MADSTTPATTQNNSVSEPQPHCTSSGNPDWIEKAHKSTRSVVSNWIRSVFQETCLQILKARLVAAHNHLRVVQQTRNSNNKDIHTDNNDNDITNVVVTQQDFEACTHACRRLGKIWCQKLRQRGIYDVSRWLEKIILMENFLETMLGDIDLAVGMNEDDKDDDDDDDDEMENQDDLQKEDNVTENNNGDSDSITISDGNDLNINEFSSTTGAPESCASTTTLVLTKLQRLGEDDSDDEDDNDDQDTTRTTPRVSRRPEKYIRILDEMGKEGSTLWPYGWDIIEKAAERNTKRIHFETISGRPKPASRVTKNYEVVPKELASTTTTTDSQDGGGDHTSEGNEIITTISEHDHDENGQEEQVPIQVKENSEKLMPWVVQRTLKKRKRMMETGSGSSLGNATQPSTLAMGNMTGQDVALLASLPPPRQPSLIQGEQRWSWKEDILDTIPDNEKKYLEDTMIRDDNEEEPSNSVLGALKSVGHIHLCLEGSKRFGSMDVPPSPPPEVPTTLDSTIDDNTNPENSQKLQRGILRKAQIERLGPKRLENIYKLYLRKKYSKVARTTNDQQERHMELDLGECLMQVKSAASGRRFTCAFSTLEVSLEDGTGLC